MIRIALVVSGSLFCLSGCAGDVLIGTANSPRGLCAEAGLPPGSPEWSRCWRAVRDGMPVENFVGPTPTQPVQTATPTSIVQPPTADVQHGHAAVNVPKPSATVAGSGAPNPDRSPLTTADRSRAQTAAVTLPEHGVLRAPVDRDMLAPLEITTSDSENYFVKVVDADTSRTVMTMFIRHGQTLKVHVPLGAMRIRYATGKIWQGEEKLFGPKTSFFQADHVFRFTRDADGFSGYAVELIKQPNGNLSTSPISRSEF